MPIKIYSDRIELSDKVITATPTGIRIDDSLLANTQNTRVGSTNFTARELAYGNFVFQGSIAGYAVTGNNIDKFPFATSTTNATDTGNLLATWGNIAGGQSSATHGYACGGYNPGVPGAVNTIQKFLFNTNSNSTDVGDLATAVYNPSGQSSSVNGYTSVGTGVPPAQTPSAAIQKFPFATDTNASNIGSLTVARRGAAGQSSKTHGYASGGQPPLTNTIDKFSFVADANGTDVGDLTQARHVPAGQSSTTHGYTSGGYLPSPSVNYNTIDKFPFSSDANATDVGDLTQIRSGPSGQSSTTHGYASGGFPTTNTIDRFPFSADTNATDVGDLAVANYYQAGCQI